MLTVNVHDAKTHLSALLAGLDDHGPFVIARAGVPVATVAPTNVTPSRIGFMKGQPLYLPDDFDSLADDTIAALFEADGAL